MIKLKEAGTILEYLAPNGEMTKNILKTVADDYFVRELSGGIVKSSKKLAGFMPI